MTDEQWKPIPGFEGYEVSDRGRVRSYLTRAGGSWHVGAKPRRILRPGKKPYGYPYVNLSRDGISHVLNVHQLVMEAFVGPRPDDMEVCHINGNPEDNRLENLRYDTHSANMQDAGLHGSYAVDPEIVLAMRRDRASGMSVKNIAKKYGLRYWATVNICNHSTYRIVGGPRAAKPYFMTLDYDDVRAIKRMIAKGMKQRAIAECFDVDESLISHIKHGRRYADIKEGA